MQVAKKNGLQADRERPGLQPSSPRSVLMYRVSHGWLGNKITEGCRPSRALHAADAPRADGSGWGMGHLAIVRLARGAFFDSAKGEFDAVVGAGFA